MALRFLADFIRRPAGERPGTTSRSVAGGGVDNRYRAVSIRAGDPSCEAAKLFGKKRFLCAKAPRLPLPECGVAECRCRYEHHSDRRSGQDRRLTYSPHHDRPGGHVNRRLGHGRRSTDAIA